MAGMIEYTPEEIADEREQTIDLLCRQYEMDRSELKQRADIYQFCEVMRLTMMMMDNLETYIMETPIVALDKEAFAFAHQAHTCLFNMHQHLGLKEFDNRPSLPEESGCVDDCTHPDHGHRR